MMTRCNLVFIATTMMIMTIMMASSSYAFTASSISSISSKISIPRYMFSTDGNEPSTTAATGAAKPLEEVDTATTAATETNTPIRTSTPVERPAMMAKNMNTGEVREVKWVDPAMYANTNPLQFDWYVRSCVRVFVRLWIVYAEWEEPHFTLNLMIDVL